MPFWKRRQEPSVWKEVFERAWAAIDDSELEPYNKAVAVSLVTGGLAAAVQTFRECRIFKERGQPRFDLALSFTEVFVMAMVSHWVRNLCDQDNTIDYRELWRDAAHQMLNLFGGWNDDRWREAWLMDRQFNQDRDAFVQRKALPFQEAHLTLCLAARGLGTALHWKLTSPPIPAEDIRTLIGAGYTLDSPLFDAFDTFFVFAALADGAKRMFEQFKELQTHESQEWKRCRGTSGGCAGGRGVQVEALVPPDGDDAMRRERNLKRGKTNQELRMRFSPDN